MVAVSSVKANLPGRFIDNGIILTEEAYVKFLEDTVPDDLIAEFIENLSQNQIHIVTKDEYEDFFYPRIEQQNGPEERDDTRIAGPKKSVSSKYYFSKEIEPDIKIIRDVAGKSDSEGSFEDFLALFKDRYKRLSRIFKEHTEMRDYISIKNAKDMELKSQVKIVGLVSEKSITKNGNILLDIEDLSGQIRAIILGSKDRLRERANYIMRDEIIGISGMLGEDVIFVNDFQFPDVSLGRPVNHAEEDINAIFTSDTHIGSNEFAEKSFLRFIKWLRQDTGNEKQRELASRVKYLVIGGDVVDGVGIYPNQQNELKITDIHKQYAETARLLSFVPEWIEILILPGNHDATRSGNPQLPIPKAFAYDLYNMGNVHMLSNPSFFSLHDVKSLVYHGDSLFDFFSQIPGFTLEDPVKPMTEMLRKRHLAPNYGMGTQIVPEPSDFLCIDEPPDIFHTGHTHINGKGIYRGVTMLNSGGWQHQTGFQRLRNIKPDVARVPIVNLKSLNTVVVSFGD
ncbi:MAG TPA: DNA-directed DNA polymerase II small subunit [Candidatus Methanofastidiosa archaeon]|nr:DNA-directed DNA polymerase II small subunit [Candidatus Methanofastidiosa archaeon]